MARSWSWLTLIEVSALAGWMGLAAHFLVGGQDAGLIPLDAKAIAVSPGQEQWNGLFVQDSHVGYEVSKASPSADGGTLYEERAVFSMVLFGEIKHVMTAGTALVDAQGVLNHFDFVMSSGETHVVASGEVRGAEIVMEVEQGGQTQELRFPLTRPPQVSASLESVLARQDFKVGTSFEVAFFDPMTTSEGTMTFNVEDVEVLPSGDEAYWLRERFHDVEARMLVVPGGEILRQESPMMSTVRMTEADAKNISTAAEPADLIAMSAVHIDHRVRKPRDVTGLELVISGVEPERVRHQPPLQVLEGDHVRLSKPDLTTLPSLPIEDRSEAEWVAPTANLPSLNPEIIDRAKAVTAGAVDRQQAARMLVDFVHDYLEKVPTIGIPNGLEVLHTARGDCNEHTALYVSLARSIGIPSRIAAGVVYSDRVADTGAFYYHAWPEVRLGGDTDWVPVDPTFGQFPADATHVKLVEGDLEKQVEIMAVMGKLGFKWVAQTP